MTGLEHYSQTMLKRVLIILSTLSLLPALLWAVTLLQFTGEVLDDQAVELRWRVDSVLGVTAFDVERSTNNQHFQVIGERVPVGNGLEYSLIDRPGLADSPRGRDRATDVEQSYYYRLFYVLPGGARQQASSEALHVSFQLSTVSVTWGSIKAMFR